MVSRQSNVSSAANVTDFWQYDASSYIWKIVSPILLVLGTIGNLLSILVLLRPKLRQSTTMFYLTCLSFGDLFSLYTGLLRYWVRVMFQTDIRNFSSASCKIHTFLVYYSLDFTVWVLVSVTFDRCLSVSLPFRAKRICTLSRSKIVVGVLLFVFFVKNMHFFWTVDMVQTWEYRCDGMTEEYDNFLRLVWPWIDMTTFCVLPFLIMIVCNIKIIYEMVVSHKKLAAHNFPGHNGEPSRAYTSQISCVEHSGMSVQSVPSALPTKDAHKAQRFSILQATGTQNNRNNSKNPRRRISSLSAMLLTVNCVFLITTTPIQVFLIGDQYWFGDRTPEDVANYHLWWAIVNMLQYSNNSIHFFLYCITGPRFRNEFKSMFKRKNKIAAAAAVHEHTHTEL